MRNFISKKLSHAQKRKIKSNINKIKKKYVDNVFVLFIRRSEKKVRGNGG